MTQRGVLFAVEARGCELRIDENTSFSARQVLMFTTDGWAISQRKEQLLPPAVSQHMFASQ